jgi:hypothetical protein
MSNFEKLYEKTLQRLEEALGVPENIVQEARRVYEEFLKLIDSNTQEKTLKDFDLAVGNKTFKDIKISLKLIPDKDLSLKSLSVPARHNFDVFVQKSKIAEDIPEIICTVNVPVEFDQNNLKQFFVDSKLAIVPLIAHELHHVFVNSVNLVRNAFNLASDTAISNYVSGVLPKTGILSIDGFISSLYLLSAMEILVYPSELAAKIELNNIRKAQFLEFLESNDIYKILSALSRFSYGDFLKELERQEDAIDGFLKSKEGTIEQKIKKCLEIVVSDLSRDIATSFAKYVKTGINAALDDDKIPPIEEIRLYVQKIQKKLAKHKGREEQFFKDSINNFKEQANITKRKLAKLYGLCKENYVTNEELLGESTTSFEKIIEEVDRYNELAEQMRKRYE